jgi:hypothetical protein
LIQRWNGASWANDSTPTLPGASDRTAELRGVSCASPTFCVAVGEMFRISDWESAGGDPTATPHASVALHWDGASWTVVPRPSGAPELAWFDAQLGRLSGVSCTGPTQCFAVGDSAWPERWNGTRWTIAPMTGSTSLGGLEAVDCLSATNCFGVGRHYTLRGAHTLVEHWNGVRWSPMRSDTPPAASFGGELLDVSCARADRCFAVGLWSKFDYKGPYQQRLIEIWNGARWRSIASPIPSGSTFGGLTGVSCVSVRFCLAVGFYSPKNSFDVKPLVERWSNGSWSLVAVPGVKNGFETVDCVAANDCFASGGPELLMHWDGHAWSTVPLERPSADATIWSLSCATPQFCMGVGDRRLRNRPARPLFVRYDGRRWSVVASPPAPPGRSFSVYGVSCASARSCDAVGTSAGNNSFRPLAEHWDGARWKVVPAPAPSGSAASQLNAVSCRSGAPCAAVGWSLGDTGQHVLTMQRG